MNERKSEGVVPGVFGFAVRSYECGPDENLTLPNVCNYLQEAACLDAEARGFSKTNFEAQGEELTWMLTRLRVVMTRYPKWEEKVKVVTFPRGFRRIVAGRDFKLVDASGETVGRATSEWVMIDLKSRKIVPIPEAVLEAAKGGPEPVLGEEPFTKRLAYPADGKVAFGPARYRTARADIDMNGHINNVHYVAWLIDPLDAQPRDFEIVFRNEAFAGVDLTVEIAETPEGLFHRVSGPDGAVCALARTRAV